MIAQVDTTSEVDLDQLFNSLNEETVRSIKSVIKGFARSYDGVGPQANRGFYYLNPFLSTSRRVFGELNSDQPALESLIVDGASLTEALAERAPDLEALIGNLDQMMGAIGRQETELASAIGQFPDFMRQFNTTAVNLRAALDDVDPLITASRPVARKLQPFTKRLRGFARDAVPTVRDLDSIVRAPGAANDLIELTELQVPLAEIGVGPVNRNGASRRARCRSRQPRSAPTARTAAPRAPTTTAASTSSPSSAPTSPRRRSPAGSTTSATPASRTRSAAVGRINATFNAFTPADPAPAIPLFDVIGGDAARPARRRRLDVGNASRCPGANVHGAQLSGTETTQLDYQGDPYLQGGALDCDPSQTLPGP